MPEADKEGGKYQVEQPQTAPGFYLKGSHQLDWGMKNRLARIFAPTTGRTVMLAIDHGYFQGPTTGLERIDSQHRAAVVLLRRLVLYARHPAVRNSGRVHQADGTACQRRAEHPREELSDEQIAMDMEDAVRLNAAGVGIQVFIGGEFETRPSTT